VRGVFCLEKESLSKNNERPDNKNSKTVLSLMPLQRNSKIRVTDSNSVSRNREP
jgi:hypothetical protein